MFTYLQVRTRTAYLRGETDFTTDAANTTINSHINASVDDILNMYPFSWDITSATLAITNGQVTLPSNFNPIFHCYDVRLVGSAPQTDLIFDEIPIEQRNNFYSNSIYWLTFNGTNWILNTPATGNLTIFYYFIPTDMVNDADICLVPDLEAVAYLAAAKMYIGDERNQKLKQDYEQEAMQRIVKLWQNDNQFGAFYKTGSPVDFNDLTSSSR